jgi:hypothetical protein
MSATGGTKAADIAPAMEIATNAAPYIEASYADKLAVAFSQAINIVRSSSTSRVPMVKSNFVMQELDAAMLGNMKMEAKEPAEKVALVTLVKKDIAKNKAAIP